MNIFLYRLKRAFHKRGTVLVVLLIVLGLFAYQLVVVPQGTGTIAQQRVGEEHQQHGQSQQAEVAAGDGETVPFYKMNRGKAHGGEQHQDQQPHGKQAGQQVYEAEKEQEQQKQQLRESQQQQQPQGEKQAQVDTLTGLKNSRLKELLLMDSETFGRRAAAAQKFYNAVFDIFLKGKPSIGKLDKYKTEDRIYHAGYDGPSEIVFTEEYLRGFLQLSGDEVSSLKQSHATVVENLPKSAPGGIYKGNGIVYVGGGKFNWLALLSIKSLRSLGSTLPVEVVIPSEDEYEIDLCTRIFPALDAKCILLPHALGDTATSKFQFKGYQYKALAIMVSSFENVLLLDSDNIPAHAPDYLFENEPFKSSGLITWPDFWRRATSPMFYEIANIEVTNERVRFGYDDRDKDLEEVSFHDRKGTIPDPTSESGQLMISKRTHSRELLLALYYNLYGPDYYYPLLSQGSDGEGDKETFLAATVALGSPSYQVKKFLNAFGHFNLEHDFVGCGMGQYDPVEDYNLELSKKRREQLSKDLDQELPPLAKDPRILFVHANFPKLNPVTLKEEGKVFESNGERLRLYGPGMAKRVGYDFELIQWRNMHFLVCELKIELSAFNGQDYSTVCKEILDQLDHLERTVKDNERD